MQLLDFRNNEITFMHWQYQESPVNMRDWCSQPVGQVTKFKCFIAFLDEKKHAFWLLFLGGQLTSNQWRQKVK